MYTPVVLTAALSPLSLTRTCGRGGAWWRSGGCSGSGRLGGSWLRCRASTGGARARGRGTGLGSCDGGGDRCLLDEDAGPVVIFSCGVSTSIRETKDADVPVSGVGGRACSLVGDDLGERAGASGEPETDGAAGEVDVVGEVVPGVGGESGGPLRDSANIPAKKGVGRSLLSRNQTELEFGEVALEAENN